MPFGFNFGINDTDSGNFDIDIPGSGFDADIPVVGPDPNANLPDIEDDSTDLDTYLDYVDTGIGIIGDILGIGKDLGLIDDETTRDIQDTKTSFERDLSKWFDDTFGTVISDRTVSTLLPWVIGLSAAGLIIYFATRKRSA